MKEETYYEVYRLSTLDRGNRSLWVMRKSHIKSLEEARKFVRNELALEPFWKGDFEIFRICRHLESIEEEASDVF